MCVKPLVLYHPAYLVLENNLQQVGDWEVDFVTLLISYLPSFDSQVPWILQQNNTLRIKIRKVPLGMCQMPGKIKKNKLSEG